jgi:phosphomannomutase
MTPNNLCFLFDVDGTLTEPRQPMTSEFELFFTSWLKNKNVYLVSGSDLPKIKEQVPNNILEKCQGIFSCMGNEYWRGEECIYQNELELPDEIEEWLSSKVKNSTFEYQKPPHFEYRSGALNFSIVGRGASQHLRTYYSEWDETNRERKTVAQQFNKKFRKKYNIEALIGGQISFDIQPVGNDKGQVINHIDGGEIIFFGDKCYEGGNDYSLAQKADTFWQVNSWKETHQILISKYE